MRLGSFARNALQIILVSDIARTTGEPLPTKLHHRICQLPQPVGTPGGRHNLRALTRKRFGDCGAYPRACSCHKTPAPSQHQIHVSLLSDQIVVMK